MQMLAVVFLIARSCLLPFTVELQQAAFQFCEYHAVRIPPPTITCAAGTQRSLVDFDEKKPISDLKNVNWSRPHHLIYKVNNTLDLDMPSYNVAFEKESTINDVIIRYANGWSKFTGRQFICEPHLPCVIRISTGNTGYRSKIGKASQEEALKGNITMDLGGIEKLPPKLAEATVLHEFGHALGLEHEHKNPNLVIKWKESVVVNHYLKQYGWPRDMTFDQVIRPFSSSEKIKATKWDPLSIMQYPIPSEFTFDGVSVGLNYEISETDGREVERLYRCCDLPVIEIDHLLK